MENDKGLNLNLDSAIALANLSVEVREDYLSFINDFVYYINMINRRNAIFKKNCVYNFDVDDFLELCQRKIEGNKDINIKSPLRLYYVSLINNHKVFLREILKNKVDFAKLYYSGVLTDIELNEKFINYLNSVNDFDLIVRNNLKKIKDIGIDKITLKEGINLDGDYTMSIIKNPNKFEDGNTRYTVVGTLCDGEKDNYSKIDENTYAYDAKDVKFIIRFAKGIECNNGIDIILSSLVFNPDSLPNKAVLSDTTILPDFDFRRADLQYKAVKMISLYSDAANLSKELNNRIDKLLQFLKNNDCNMQYLELLIHSTDCQVLSGILESREKEFLEDLSQCVSSDTTKKLIMRRKEYDKNKE